MRRCNTLSCLELETSILEYIGKHPKSNIEEIASNLDYQYQAVRRILEGREGSRSIIGLVNAGAVKVLPGMNSKGNLCWVYEIV